jgi:3-hydroxyacyl-CoA dehydrogenase/enoyl-CoA hydratase/3-hydroxybutyryl-CoA epimerase
MDAVGLATVAQVAGNLGQAYAGRWGAIPTALGEMAKAGLTGRRGQAGFYSYPAGAGQAPKPNPRARQIMEAGGIAENVVPGEPAERCLLAMANEAAWCLEQGVIAGPRDGDLAAVLGVSFPAFRGGPFHYLDALGLGRAVSLLETLADSAGARFEPAPVLRDLARKEGSFF